MQLMCSGCWGTHLCKQAWFQFSSTSLLITREQQDRQGVHPKSMRHDKVLLARIAGDALYAFQWQQAHSYIRSAVPQ